MMMALDSSPGNHVNQDQWDGYSAERTEILTHFHVGAVKNLVVLSGDLHTFVAGNLTTTGADTTRPAAPPHQPRQVQRPVREHHPAPGLTSRVVRRRCREE
jgi:PhoD-like phosphatase